MHFIIISGMYLLNKVVLHVYVIIFEVVDKHLISFAKKIEFY